MQIEILLTVAGRGNKEEYLLLFSRDVKYIEIHYQIPPTWIHQICHSRNFIFLKGTRRTDTKALRQSWSFRRSMTNYPFTVTKPARTINHILNVHVSCLA